MPVSRLFLTEMERKQGWRMRQPCESHKMHLAECL